MARHPGALTATFKPKNCQYCGKKFLPTNAANKFCGRICREKNYKEVKRNEQAITR